MKYFSECMRIFVGESKGTPFCLVSDGPVDGIALDPPSSVSVVAGNPFTLRCSANCHPPCDYEWFQGPQAKMSEGGKLDVRKATEAEGGSYTCRAVNGVGSAVSEPVMVEVQCEGDSGSKCLSVCSSIPSPTQRLILCVSPLLLSLNG